MSGRRPRDQKISPGRDAYDPRWLIAYCSDFKCSHSVVIDGAQWGDDVRLSDLEPKFVLEGSDHDKQPDKF
jgi:hypothetical protein